jgi:hypothetical protein
MGRRFKSFGKPVVRPAGERPTRRGSEVTGKTSNQLISGGCSVAEENAILLTASHLARPAIATGERDERGDGYPYANSPVRKAFKTASDFE